ncbi:deoxyuridine 5'-triphosphate nucleotidohydrolase [bacterium]|nr:deoxyuridine 5'-triphosphate nucleotidohydrolase [bacterium]
MIIRPEQVSIEGMLDKCLQIQGAGIDITVLMIERFTGVGAIDFDNSRRKLPETEEIPWIEAAGAAHDKNGETEYSAGLENAAFVKLTPGGYIVRYNEIIEVPDDAIGIVLPRSSLMRAGATLHSAVWDPGYRGRGQGLLSVTNPIRIHRNARIGQIVFIRMEKKADKLYNGTYQNEGV